MLKLPKIAIIHSYGKCDCGLTHPETKKEFIEVKDQVSNLLKYLLTLKGINCDDMAFEILRVVRSELLQEIDAYDYYERGNTGRTNMEEIKQIIKDTL